MDDNTYCAVNSQVQVVEMIACYADEYMIDDFFKETLPRGHKIECMPNKEAEDRFFGRKANGDE